MGGQTSSNEQKVTPDRFAKVLCSEVFGSDLGRVGFKFVRDMLVGIQRTRSVNLTDIAKGLNEDIRLHATHKRLSRNLDDPELAASLSDRLLRMGAEGVRRNTRLIVHLYELNKKYARKVEYLPEPGLHSDAGFKVCEILASDPESETYTPLLANVWSDKVPGFVSDAEEVKKTLRRVARATDNKGLFYFDDHSLSGEFLKSIIVEPGLNYLAMMTGTEMDVMYKNESISMNTLTESVQTPYGRTMFKLIPEGASGVSKNTDIDVFLHAGALAIRLPDMDRNLRLIALKAKNRFVGEIASPMITTETNLRSRKALMGMVESFLSVQDVVLTHQALRDSFDPSSFRVLTYDRLQLLMALLQGVIHYEVALARNVSISDHLFSDTPHDGDMNRTYFLPEQQEAQESRLR
ncbi:MAG: hypothetical protein ACR2QT_12535 [Woeseiaceae bacterium]